MDSLSDELSELFSHSPIERVIDGVSDYVIGRVMD
jgi:hypothetical protein